LSRKREPKKKDFVDKRKALSRKTQRYKLLKMFFPLTMTGFFDTERENSIFALDDFASFLYIDKAYSPKGL
jgi:hypothetical protein